MKSKEFPLKVEGVTKIESPKRGKYKAGKHSETIVRLDELGSSYFALEYSGDEVKVVIVKDGDRYSQTLSEFIKNANSTK